MPAMVIRSYPDNFLRKKAQNVEKAGDEEKKILSDMAETMYLKGGVGLAAVQVGIAKKMIVVDIGDGIIKMMNPAILKSEGSEIQEEGCLSVPDTCVRVKRAKKIMLEYLNEKGEVVHLAASGLLARVIQHEVDHLFGKLIVDYISPLKKLCNSLTIRKL